MKKLYYLPFPMLLMVWCLLLLANTYAVAQTCETYFKYSFQNNFCPAKAECLIADNVNYTFSALSGADYYSWNFGDGNTQIDSIGKVSHAYFKPGKFPVSVIAYYNYKSAQPCKTVFKEEITVVFQSDSEPSPADCKAVISSSTDGLSLKIWDEYLFNKYHEYKNTNEVYFWDFGDGNKFVGNTPTHNYKGAGKYMVTMTKLVFVSYKSSEVCTASLTVDGQTVKFPCYQKEICRETYTKWVTVGEESSIKSCNTKAQIDVNSNQIKFRSGPFYTYDSLIKIYPMKLKDELVIPQPVENVLTINYWSFGDGKDTVALSGTHNYSKSGKYLVLLHSAKYSNIKPEVACLGLSYDFFLNTLIPCHYKLECRSVDSVWVDIKGSNEMKCLETSVSNFDLKVSMALSYTKEYQPGIIRHRYYNFGEGTDTMGVQQATHTYAKNGTYLVTGTEVTYYSEVQRIRELYPDSSIMQCMRIYYDSSVKFGHTDCPITEISRISCSEWVTINTEKLVTSVYPNPTNEFGNLAIENAEGIVDFMVYNAAGMLVQKMESIVNGTQQFATENLANGLYIYTISRDGKVLKRDKFAVNH